MKKTIKKIVCLVLVVAFVFSLAGCAKINYVTNATIGAINQVKSGEWKTTDTADAADSEDVSVLDKEFEAGTYGGVEFKTQDDVVNYYVEAYNYTKSLTAQYLDENGATQTWYKLIGEEDLQVGTVMIDGSENALINKLVPTIVNKLFSKNTYGLVPCNNRNPETDNNSDDDKRKADHDFRTSMLTADDVLAANVAENSDGTITLTIQPKAAEMSTRGDDSQGRFFEVLGDISGTVADIDMISFTEGTAEDNVKVTYKGGTGVITIDPSTKEITTADYTMVALVSVTHASISAIKNKSASLDITYTNHYPASDDYLKENKSITRVK